MSQFNPIRLLLAIIAALILIPGVTFGFTFAVVSMVLKALWGMFCVWFVLRIAGISLSEILKKK